jgi:two-component system, OmpR family, phosphate regulon sensor histidine kinase PhoR
LGIHSPPTDPPAQVGSLNPRQSHDLPATLLGMAGHDLRQPLQVLQSTCEWLAAHIESPPDRVRLERAERAVGRITEQLDRLVGLLRIYEHRGSIETTPVRLAAMLQRICDEYQDAATEKGIKLRMGPASFEVMSNPVLLEGILRNLLQNAVKYTKPGVASLSDAGGARAMFVSTYTTAASA